MDSKRSYLKRVSSGESSLKSSLTPNDATMSKILRRIALIRKEQWVQL